MRMWNVNPRFLCRAHLLGEHRELHMLAGALRKGVRLQPLVAQGLVEPYAVQARHDLLVAEMEARGFRRELAGVGDDGQIARAAFHYCPESPGMWIELVSHEIAEEIGDWLATAAAEHGIPFTSPFA